MGLYERDYLKGPITEEMDEYNKILAREIEEGIDGIKLSLYEEYPSAIKHYNSLFPNHFLNVDDIRENDSLSNMIYEFENLINNLETRERDILNFINGKRYYPLIGAILKDYHFGHHGAYLFKEFPLGTSYQVDYLLIGDCSEGHHLVFVELEDVNGITTRGDGYYSIATMKGIHQVKDWKRWIESHYGNLKEIFNKYKLSNKSLPDELLEYNSSRIHYVVVCGRREHYNSKTYDERMEYQKSNDIKILHYDNLIDLANRLNDDFRTY